MQSASGQWSLLLCPKPKPKDTDDPHISYIHIHTHTSHITSHISSHSRITRRRRDRQRRADSDLAGLGPGLSSNQDHSRTHGRTGIVYIVTVNHNQHLIAPAIRKGNTNNNSAHSHSHSRTAARPAPPTVFIVIYRKYIPSEARSLQLQRPRHHNVAPPPPPRRPPF